MRSTHLYETECERQRVNEESGHLVLEKLRLEIVIKKEKKNALYE